MSEENAVPVTPSNPLGLDIEAIVRDAHDQLVRKAVADVLSDVSYSVRRSLAENIGPIVKKFVTEEFEPALTAELFGKKSQIIAAAAAEVPRIAQAVAKAMATNLAINHKRDQIIKALTGG